MDTVASALQVALGALFLAIGIPKLARTRRFQAEFRRYGYPAWMLPLTGAVEAGGGLVLLAGFAWPSLAPFAAWWLAATMVGALFTHARLRDPLNRYAAPAVLLVAAVVVAVLRRGA